MDYGHKMTDKELQKLEKKFHLLTVPHSANLIKPSRNISNNSVYGTKQRKNVLRLERLRSRNTHNGGWHK